MLTWTCLPTQSSNEHFPANKKRNGIRKCYNVIGFNEINQSCEFRFITDYASYSLRFESVLSFN